MCLKCFDNCKVVLLCFCPLVMDAARRGLMSFNEDWVCWVYQCDGRAKIENDESELLLLTVSKHLAVAVDVIGHCVEVKTVGGEGLGGGDWSGVGAGSIVGIAVVGANASCIDGDAAAVSGISNVVSWEWWCCERSSWLPKPKPSPTRNHQVPKAQP